MTLTTAFFAILAALAMGAVSPGPTFVLVSRIAVTSSRRHGLAAALGTGIGGLIFAALAMAGLTALLLQVESLALALRLAGGAYLMYLGVMIWRGAAEPMAEAPNGNDAQSPLKAFWVALMTQVSNPKTAIVYASVFAAMLPHSIPLWMQVSLPLAIGVMEMLWYGAVALTLSSRRPKAAYLSLKPLIDRLAGSVMAILGARLIYEATLGRKALV